MRETDRAHERERVLCYQFGGEQQAEGEHNELTADHSRESGHEPPVVSVCPSP